jgi:hypothetical protein
MALSPSQPARWRVTRLSVRSRDFSYRLVWSRVVCSVSCRYTQPLANSFADMAILFISTHMALQIFPMSNSILGHDGLYRVRYYVFALWVLVPLTFASLAFINSYGGYQAQGAWCWLPLRPFWYRLALSYIPLYLVWIYIMGVAIKIYMHVGYEFRMFGQERDQTSSAGMTAQSSVHRAAIADATRFGRRKSGTAAQASDEDIAPDDTSAQGFQTARRSPPESTDDVQFNPGRRASMPT